MAGIDNIRRVTILLVDDELEAREALKHMLSLKCPDYDIISCNSFEALQNMEECNPDVVIVDLDMASVDTFVYIREVLVRLPNTRIIVVSGSTDRETKIRCSRAGVSAYISKPVVFVHLCKVIKSILTELKRQKLQSQLEDKAFFPLHSLIIIPTTSPAAIQQSDLHPNVTW